MNIRVALLAPLLLMPSLSPLAVAAEPADLPQPPDVAQAPDAAQSPDVAQSPDAAPAAPSPSPDVARPPPGSSTAPLHDPPARVGRLAAMDGRVSLHGDDANDWQAARRNYPITSGMSVWSDDLAKAEVQVGTLAVRLGEHTNLLFTRLDDSAVQMGLAAGVVQVHVRELAAGQIVEVDTPVGSATLREVGTYRVEMFPQRHAAQLTVRRGRAEVMVQGTPFEVAAGRSAAWRGGPGAAAGNQTSGAAEPQDAFESWCEARDARAAQPEALRYVSRATVGYEDLDDHGSWSTTPEYGTVWRPNQVAVGWAPYHDGHWAYVSPWGWTWIDDAPWGFAPFHYGRWVYYDGGWAWTPGGYLAAPCYSPALVAFAGGVGVVTWFPLGPREIYVPGYRTSFGYIRNVNINNVVVSHGSNIAAIVTSTTYINRGVPGAVAQVPRNVLLHGAPVGAYRLGPNAGAAVGHFVVRGAPNVPRPVPGSVGRGGRGAAPPATFAPRPAALPTPGGAPRGPLIYRSPIPIHTQPARLPSPPVRPSPLPQAPPAFRPAGPPPAGHYYAPRPTYTGGHSLGGGGGGGMHFSPGRRH